MAIITKKWAEKFEKVEYLEDILNGLKEIQSEKNYSDEKMDSDLDVALWRAYVYINLDTYTYYELAEKTLAKVKDKGIKNGVWCYRYSCALVYLRRFEEALNYSRIGTEVDPTYPWGWLQLGRICYKFNLLDEAYKAIEKGLELVPNDYEFLTLKDDIENDRGYAYATSHYIDKEADKNLKERLINIDDDKLYQEFLNKSEVEKKLDILNDEDKNQEIIDLINSLPKNELNYIILGKLARAYNNNEEYEKAKNVLLKIKKYGENDSLWNFRIGYSCFYLDQFEEAQKYFEKTLEIDPDDMNANRFLVWVYSELATRNFYESNFAKAFYFYFKAVEIAKHKDDIISNESNLAWAYDYVGEYEKAYKHLENLMDLGRDDIWFHSELGCCLAGMKKFKEAIPEFKKAIKMGRKDGWTFGKLGLLYKELENYDQALECFLKGLKVEPENISLLSETALLYEDQYELKKALKYLNKAKDLGRDDIWVNSEIGYCLNRTENFKDALIYLERAEELGRIDSWIFIEKGVSLKNSLKYEEALNNFLKAEEMEKDNDWLKVEISECLDNLGRTDEAIQKLLLIIATNENYNKFLVDSQLGYLYGRKNNYEEALKYLYKAKDLGRDDIWVNSEIGWNLMSIAEYKKALTYYNKAVQLGRDDIWINGQLGFTLSKLNQFKEAISYFEKARFIDSNDDWVAYQLAICYRKEGDIEKALALLNPLLKKSAYKGWVEFELAWCYALIEEKEKANDYLKEAYEYISGDIISSSELQREYDTLKKLILTKTYLA